jgi:dTDP-4-amino-4,6-dideoxygalactose transaminase
VPSLAGVAEVRSVPFPGDAFDQAVEEGGDDVVVVDLTYLDEDRVRPLITGRFAGSDAVVVFVGTAGHTARMDDLVALVAGNTLHLVPPQ